MLGPLAHLRPRLPGPGDQDGPSSHPQMPPSLGTAYQEPWKLSLKIHCSYFLFYVFLASHPLCLKPQDVQRQHTGTRHRDTHKSSAVNTEQNKREASARTRAGQARHPEWAPGEGHTEDPSHQGTAVSPPCQKGWGSRETWPLHVLLTHTERHC